MEMDIDAIVGKEPDQLNDDEKKYLNDHSEELTTGEKQRFGIEVKLPAPPETPPAKKEGEGDEGEGGDGVDPEDEKKIGAIVDKRMGKAISGIAAAQMRTEINTFIADNPDYKPYRESIEKFKQHPAYSGLPVSQIANIVAGTDLMKIGARRERLAQRKAVETKGGGSTQRPTKVQGTDWSKASREEFEKERARVLGQS